MEIVNLGLKDSLLRLNETNIERILEERCLGDRGKLDLLLLQRELSAAVCPGVIIAPIGIGHHIDHVLTSLAAAQLDIPPESLLFYLDAPYWLRVDPQDVRRRIEHMETLVGHTLSPYVPVCPGTFSKSELMGIYSSQLREEDIRMVVRAPFQGEVLLGVPQAAVCETVLLVEGTWTALKI